MRSKTAISSDIAQAQKALYLQCEMRKIAFALDIAHQPLKLKYCFPPSVGTRFLICMWLFEAINVTLGKSIIELPC